MFPVRGRNDCESYELNSTEPGNAIVLTSWLDDLMQSRALAMVAED